MKKFLALVLCAVMVLSMFATMALPTFADEDEEEEIDPNEWLADHIQSVDGDWLTRRGPSALGKEDEYTPAGGYYYDTEGFHTLSPDYTNMTPSYAVISKETYNLQDGFSMTFRVDEFSYKGEDGGADEWIAITIGNNQLLTPGNTTNGYGSGWVSLNRGTGNGSTSTESFWSQEKDEDGNGGAFAHQGSLSSSCAMDGDKEIYTLEVSYDGSAYTIKVNDVTIAGNANVSNKLDELNSDGDFYIGIVFHSGVTNGKAALSITEVNGATPTGRDDVAAEENTLVYGDMIDSSTVPANQPALLFDANKETFKKDPDMQNCTVEPNGDGSYTIYSYAAASFVTWSVKNAISYNAADFPVFCMMVRNLDGANGILYQLSGDNLSAGENCMTSWDMYDYDEDEYEREWTDDDDNYWNLIVVDLSSDEITIDNEGRLHGCRIDFGGLDTSGEYPFDLMYMAYFRSEEECQAYAEQYLVKAGVLEGESPVETDPVETDPVETDPVETDPVETDPVETDPVETDPVETDPVETGSVETETAGNETVAETEPAGTTADTTAGTTAGTDAATAVAEEDGCSSVIGVGAAALVLSAMATAVALKKKH